MILLYIGLLVVGLLQLLLFNTPVLSRVPSEETLIALFFPWVIFILSAFKIFSCQLRLTMMCIGRNLFECILFWIHWDSWMCRLMLFIKFIKFENFSNYFFEYFPYLSLLFFFCDYYFSILVCLILHIGPKALFIFLQLFFSLIFKMG